MQTPEELALALAPHLKEMGYKKVRSTWYKEIGPLTLVFSIQKSQFGADVWYYYFGIGLQALTPTPIKSIGKCQITYRVDQIENNKTVTCDNLVHLVRKWETMYGDLRKLRVCAIEGRLSGQCTPAARRYLTSVDLSAL